MYCILNCGLCGFSEWDPNLIAILLQKGLHINKLCRYAQLKTGFPGRTESCSVFTSCRWSTITEYPSDANSQWLPTRDTINSWLVKPPINNTWFKFDVPIQACLNRNIYWIHNSQWNALN